MTGDLRPSVRGLFVLQALALGAVAGVAALGLGLPLAARRALGPAELAALALMVALAVFGLGTALLLRSAARPVDRLLAAAARLRAGAGELPLLGGDTASEGAGSLSRPAVAFERLASALEQERGQLAAKVRELTQANAALAEAREGLLRSERLATVGRIAAGLAHEIGNPLGAVTGYAELARGLLPPGCDPEVPGSLDRIAAAATRIDRIVRDLLDLARPLPPLLGPVAVGGAIEAALRLARVQARFRDVEVEVEVPAALPEVVADEHRLVQVLLNLLLNAGDAMGGLGRVRIAGSTDPHPGRRRASGADSLPLAAAGFADSGPGGSAPRAPDPHPFPLPSRERGTTSARTVTLTVEDSGPGIPPADLPHVFDPFFTTKEPGAGTGLGLAIAQQALESFGGSVAARNGERGGAVFELRFAAA